MVNDFLFFLIVKFFNQLQKHFRSVRKLGIPLIDNVQTAFEFQSH